VAAARVGCDAGTVPELVLPTVTVRDSFLAGERAACAQDGTSPSWLDAAEAWIRLPPTT
jgi:hypothetical protein